MDETEYKRIVRKAKLLRLLRGTFYPAILIALGVSVYFSNHKVIEIAAALNIIIFAESEYRGSLIGLSSEWKISVWDKDGVLDEVINQEKFTIKTTKFIRLATITSLTSLLIIVLAKFTVIIVSPVIIGVVALIYKSMNSSEISDSNLITTDEDERWSEASIMVTIDRISDTIVDSSSKMEDSLNLNDSLECSLSLVDTINKAELIINYNDRYEVKSCIKSILEVREVSIINLSELLRTEEGLKVLDTKEGNDKVVAIYQPLETDIENLVTLALEVESNLMGSGFDDKLTKLTEFAKKKTSKHMGETDDSVEEWNRARDLSERIKTSLKMNSIVNKETVESFVSILNTVEFDPKMCAFILGIEDEIEHLEHLARMNPHRVKLYGKSDERILHVEEFVIKLKDGVEEVSSIYQREQEGNESFEREIRAKSLYDFL